jgi:transcription-repair coupling factor (superfamily II helicase)
MRVRMNLSGLLPLLHNHPAYRRLVDAAARALANPDHPAIVAAEDLLDAAKPYLLAALAADSALGPPAGRIFVLTSRPERARQIADALRLYAADPAAVAPFPAPDLLPYEQIAADPALVAGRLAVLALLSGRPSAPPAGDSPLPSEGRGAGGLGSRPVVVASAMALMTPTLSPADFRWAVRTVRKGQEIAMDDLLAHWVDLGYEPAATVETRGAFSRRGGIVDIWPPPSEAPVRLEFWGDEIESLRYFDPDTQRSSTSLDSLLVPPSCELPLWRRNDVVPQLREIDLGNTRTEVREEWQRNIAGMEIGEFCEGRELFAPYFSEPLPSLLAYLEPGDLVVVDNPEAVALAAGELERSAEELHAELVAQGELPADLRRPYLAWSDLAAALAATQRLTLGGLADDPESPAGEVLPLPEFTPPRAYHGNLAEAIADVRAALERGERIVVVSQQSQRLRELFEEAEIYPTRRKVPPSLAPRPAPKPRTPAPPRSEDKVIAAQLAGLIEPLLDPPAAGALHLVQAGLDAGWQGDLLLYGRLLTDLELFGRVQPARRGANKPARTAAMEEFLREVKAGDYVVHIEHGIARFTGLVKMGMGGGEREYMQLEYADGDRLYVPIEQTDRVSPYIGTGQGTPALHRLGTGDWARAKKRVQAATLELARELLALYATREAVPGHAYSPDSTWQEELEASFPYVETEDQMRAIEEVKLDMENTRPMDRLVCGDVGFGKTEVALRAAFKAVLDGKQVAVLVPTTILAQQHYTTFSTRMAAFPMTVEMLSRFRSPKDQRRILQDLAAGKVDIIIGTHRLLQKDVQFHDLGLVVVDEEQRFGVRHKERLKQLRREVDVLTMTATPIPRTLHMALVGVRDMSVIETPPEDRLPIKTYVTAYRDPLVREVIQRELERGGQVYFVHNRVQSIGIVRRELEKLLPGVRLAVAHGQMEEDQLEKVMTEFIEGKYDVLICTTIIESGLDIPNVNTMIVDNANNYGLAQLYQLRGRVGRGDKRAYAYFLYRPGHKVTDIAQERLHTIEQATELGAGFRIALKDMEIRGVGNLLGPEQHGNVGAVGFDLYTRLLAGAVEEVKGHERPIDPPPLTLDVPLTAFLPEDFVHDSGERLRLYQRLARARGESGVRDLRREIEDRFGPLPEPAENLLRLVRLKSLAVRAGVEAINTLDDEFVIVLHPAAALKRLGPLFHYHMGQRFDEGIRISQHQVRLGRRPLGTAWLPALEEVLEELAESEPAASA